MKVRSGFKQKIKKNRFRSGKAIVSFFIKKLKKLLSINLFTFNILARLKKEKPRRKSYLSRDIHKKNYENPFGKKRKGANAIIFVLKRKRFILSQLSLATVLIIWFVVLFVQPTFYIEKISIEGNEEIPQQDLLKLVKEHLEKRSLVAIRRSHLFFIKPNKLEQTISDHYGLERITFTPHWPSKSLHIKLKEKVSVLAYSVDDNYFTIDRQGILIRQLENFDELKEKNDIPLIYNYAAGNNETVGSIVLTPGNIKVITTLHEQLKKYTSFTVHSFRLKNSPKRTVTIANKRPIQPETTEDDELLSQGLDDLAEAIVNAETIDEKIATVEQLDEFKVEKLEEGEFIREIEKENVYTPNEDYQLRELEVYMEQGWSLKLGHKVFEDENALEKYLNIFATLTREVDVVGEVKEYVDLRFPNRLYYR